MRSALLLASLAAAVASWSPPAVAGEGQTWFASSDARLDEMRGGFGVFPGLTVSFGILRTVEINGQAVSSSGFQIGDLRTISLAQAAQLAGMVDAARLVQSGPGNTFAAELASGTPALIVQNTLNDQKIRTVTEINAITNGLSILRGLNLSRSLADALAAATGR